MLGVSISAEWTRSDHKMLDSSGHANATGGGYSAEVDTPTLCVDRQCYEEYRHVCWRSPDSGLEWNKERSQE